jgi:hypothetical protein
MFASAAVDGSSTRNSRVVELSALTKAHNLGRSQGTQNGSSQRGGEANHMH